MFALLRLHQSEVLHWSHGAEALSQQGWPLLQAESVPWLLPALGGLVYRQLTELPNLGFPYLLCSVSSGAASTSEGHEMKG